MCCHITSLLIPSVAYLIPHFSPPYTLYSNSTFFFFFFFLILFFLAALGLRCCVWAFSSCGKQGLLFVAVRGLLIAVASLVAEHRL